MLKCGGFVIKEKIRAPTKEESTAMQKAFKDAGFTSIKDIIKVPVPKVPIQATDKTDESTFVSSTKDLFPGKGLAK